MAINASYAKLVTLDGTELSENARTFTLDREERSVSVELASGKINRYVKGVKHTFTLTWDWLPSDDATTVDGRAGRNTLFTLVDASTAPCRVLTVRKQDGTTDTYTVFVDSYNEEIIRREIANQRYWYKVSLTLKEQ